MKSFNINLQKGKRAEINIRLEEGFCGECDVAVPLGILVDTIQDAVSDWDMLNEEEKNLFRGLALHINMIEQFSESEIW